ncbi:MAG: PD-(D/E)XK nuclease family protein [Deinococcota bacterium]
MTELRSQSTPWSFTRDQALRSCPRRYYFQYHLAPAGVKAGASRLARQAFALSRLTSLDQALGVAIHHCARMISQAVKRKQALPSADALTQRVRYALNRAYSASRDAAVRPYVSRDLQPLREFYYAGGVTDG